MQNILNAIKRICKIHILVPFFGSVVVGNGLVAVVVAIFVVIDVVVGVLVVGTDNKITNIDYIFSK